MTVLSSAALISQPFLSSLVQDCFVLLTATPGFGHSVIPGTSALSDSASLDRSAFDTSQAFLLSTALTLSQIFPPTVKGNLEAKTKTALWVGIAVTGGLLLIAAGIIAYIVVCRKPTVSEDEISSTAPAFPGSSVESFDDEKPISDGSSFQNAGDSRVISEQDIEE
jgi:hypothetical protein